MVRPAQSGQVQVWEEIKQTLQSQPCWAWQVAWFGKDEHPAAVPEHPHAQPQSVHVLPVPMVEQGTLDPTQL